MYASVLLYPIMPTSSETIFKLLNLDIKTLNDLEKVQNTEVSFKKPDNLFNRI